MYISQAMEHHNASLKAASPFIANICPENSIALYMFSVLTFLFSLACLKKPNKQGSTIRSTPLTLICWKDTKYLPSAAESYENEHFKELEYSIKTSSLKDARKK